MYDSRDELWLESRLKDRAEKRIQKRVGSRNPNFPVVDASKFSAPLSELTGAIINLVERVGRKQLPDSPIPTDTGVILRQLRETFDLLRFINSDETRLNNTAYRTSFSFVSLPLVRTLIDGFYNCTALLDKPSRSRRFRISGLYRLREALRDDEGKYGGDQAWNEFLAARRQMLNDAMHTDQVTDADLDNENNKWPLLGSYLRRGDTPHKRVLRKLTLGFWKDYSSTSHASYDGLVSIYPFIALDRIPHESHEGVADAAERHLGMHFARAAGVVLCLLTELQHFYRFDSARIDDRLNELWIAMLPIFEIRELYEFRYRELLRKRLGSHLVPTYDAQ